MENSHKKRTILLCLFFLSMLFAACSKWTGHNKTGENAQTPTPVPESIALDYPISTPEPTIVPTLEPTHVPTPVPEPDVPVNAKLSTFSTNILDKSWSRINNIKIATKTINGYIVKPGETFSFNGVLGERSKEKGYKKAKAIVNNKRVYEEGGGVCQVSSTLYNSVQQAGLEVLERHSHTKEIHYLPLGQDAAVAYGSLDFKFKNTKSYPIKIEVYVMDYKVIASIIRAE